MADRDITITGGTISGGIAIGVGAMATGAGGDLGIDAADVPGIAARLRALLPKVPAAVRDEIEDRLVGIEAEAAKRAPDTVRVQRLLRAIKTIGQGVVASLIANAMS